MIERMATSRFLATSRSRLPAAVLATVLLAAGCGSGGGDGADSKGVDGKGASTSSRPTPTPTPTRAPTSSTPPPDYRAELTRAIAAQPKGSVSVAAVNLSTHAQVSGGSTSGQWMASTYKLFLTEARLAVDGSVNQADAAAAIEHSDNKAGYRLFLALGSTSGTVAAFRRFGLTHTHMPANAYDPTFATTSAPDWIRILRALVGPGQLSASQRKYVLSLLGQVEGDQRWGVGAAATGSFVNKNGWESVDSTNTPPEPADGGRWIVNSVGIVTRHGQRLLMAVMTQHNAAFAGGVKLVEKLAKLAGAAVTS